jgi:hypothetical protein
MFHGGIVTGVAGVACNISSPEVAKRCIGLVNPNVGRAMMTRGDEISGPMLEIRARNPVLPHTAVMKAKDEFLHAGGGPADSAGDGTGGTLTR